MTLSVLICTIQGRQELLHVLTKYLYSQIGDRQQQVEVLTNGSNYSTGLKRQQLIQEAKGDYVVFIDDDDFVYDYYIDEMLLACASGADCFAINGIMTTDGQHETKWYLSKDFKNEDRREGNKMVYYRHTNHITGVKRSIALAAGFPDKSNAEDKHYSDRLVLRSEYKIESPLYHYRFSTHNKSYK